MPTEKSTPPKPMQIVAPQVEAIFKDPRLEGLSDVAIEELICHAAELITDRREIEHRLQGDD